MQKVVEFLEKHVQWLAIGLGALFVLLMSWTYLLQTPVSDTAGTTAVNPGTVDPFIHDGIAKRVDVAASDDKLDVKSILPSGGGMKVTEEWLATLNNPKAAADFNTIALNAPAGREVAGTTSGEPTISDLKVTALPLLSPGVINGVPTVGKSQVNVPARVAFAPNPAPGSGNVTAAPPKPAATRPPAERPRVYNPNETPRNPVAPGGAMAPGVAVGNVDAQDRLWVKIPYTLPTLDLSPEWTKNLINPEYKTSILRVELWRQEVLPNGKYGPETRIEPLSNTSIPAMPVEPANGGTKDATDKYRAWLKDDKSRAMMLQPEFYKILVGEDPWAPQVVNAAVVPDPAAAAVAVAAAKAAKEEARKAEIAKKKAEAEARKAARGAGKGIGGKSGGGAVGGTRGMAVDPDAQESFQATPGALAGTTTVPGGLAGTTPPGGTVPGAVQPPGAPAQPGVPPVLPLPDESFTPDSIVADTEGWAFDDTVETGKTYRYQVKWAILNPLYLRVNAADPVTLQKQFAIWSKIDDKKWSDPVTVSSLTNFFVNGKWPNRSNQPVKFTVFRWQAGKWQSRDFTVAPGDPIGETVDGVDFSTGYTLVDARYDEKLSVPQTAVLMGPDGKIVSRDPLTDKADPEFNKLRSLANVATPEDAAANATR